MLTKVKSIQWSDALADEIDALFADLSRVMEGHSHTEEYTGGPPEVDELKTLADRVDAVIKEAKKPRVQRRCPAALALATGGKHM
jgi:hypothetical protein